MASGRIYRSVPIASELVRMIRIWRSGRTNREDRFTFVQAWLIPASHASQYCRSLLLRRTLRRWKGFRNPPSIGEASVQMVLHRRVLRSIRRHTVETAPPCSPPGKLLAGCLDINLTSGVQAPACPKWQDSGFYPVLECKSCRGDVSQSLCLT